MNYRKLIVDAEKFLKNANITDFHQEAEELLMHLLDIDTSELLFDMETDLETKFSKSMISNLISDFDQLINLRASHFPLQYIKGYEYFCGLKFNVDENVLIPRSDTETLVERVLSDNPDRNKFVLDMCTGSGCIAISLANLGKYKLVVGTDISDEALEVASKNAEENINENDFDDEMNQQVFFYRSDMFERIPRLKDKIGVDKFDIITINPPYIKTDIIYTLQDEVKKYEPTIALDGDTDGLKFYRIIALNAKDFLTENGRLYLEIGYDQADEVKKLFISQGYDVVDVVKDLSGNDRVMVLKQ